jgi:VanZ family protein
MSEEATSHEAMDEKATGNEPTNRHITSLLVNPLLRYWLPPAVWMVLIFILSAQPALPHYPDTLLDTILKKAAHVIEYGILAFLLWRALSRGQGALSRSALVTAFVVSVLYAVSDEYHQTFVPGRNGRLVDVGIDVVGALVALLVVGSLGKKRRWE